MKMMKKMNDVYDVWKCVCSKEMSMLEWLEVLRETIDDWHEML